MSLEDLWLCECSPTYFTLVVFSSLMNHQMALQIGFLVKGATADLAGEWLQASMSELVSF